MATTMKWYPSSMKKDWLCWIDLWGSRHSRGSSESIRWALLVRWPSKISHFHCFLRYFLMREPSFTSSRIQNCISDNVFSWSRGALQKRSFWLLEANHPLEIWVKIAMMYHSQTTGCRSQQNSFDGELQWVHSGERGPFVVKFAASRADVNQMPNACSVGVVAQVFRTTLYVNKNGMDW